MMFQGKGRGTARWAVHTAVHTATPHTHTLHAQRISQASPFHIVYNIPLGFFFFFFPQEWRKVLI